MVYFNKNQDYFECHEVLEEYWKSLPDGNKKHPLTAYILLATGMYHWRRENFAGALRTIRKAYKKFKRMEEHSSYTNEIDLKKLQVDIQNSIKAIERKELFTSFSIRVTSTELEILVDDMVKSLPLLPFGSEAVIHKHMLRDRNDILRKDVEDKDGN